MKEALRQVGGAAVAVDEPPHSAVRCHGDMAVHECQSGVDARTGRQSAVADVDAAATKSLAQVAVLVVDGQALIHVDRGSGLGDHRQRCPVGEPAENTAQLWLHALTCVAGPVRGHEALAGDLVVLVLQASPVLLHNLEWDVQLAAVVGKDVERAEDAPQLARHVQHWIGRAIFCDEIHAAVIVPPDDGALPPGTRRVVEGDASAVVEGGAVHTLLRMIVHRHSGGVPSERVAHRRTSCW